jgi:hypothetical protein
MDLTKGCLIKFTESVFFGTYPKSKYSHDRTIIGLILKESYGVKTGQHSFTIEVEDCDDGEFSKGQKIIRKGRNVYKKCTILSYPENYDELADEKHKRADSVKGSIKMNRDFNRGDYTAFENHEKYFKY